MIPYHRAQELTDNSDRLSTQGSPRHRKTVHDGQKFLVAKDHGRYPEEVGLRYLVQDTVRMLNLTYLKRKKHLPVSYVHIFNRYEISYFTLP